MSRPEPEAGKLAVALGTGGAGTGLEVPQQARCVEDLLREEGKGSNIPLEVYELMATVINFVQELNEARATDEEFPSREEPDRGEQTADGGDPL
jgi:flagellar biosynthesis protein FlhB